jgi:hypothetical protein
LPAASPPETYRTLRFTLAGELEARRIGYRQFEET